MGFRLKNKINELCPQCNGSTHEEIDKGIINSPIKPWVGIEIEYEFPMIICNECEFAYADYRKEDAEIAAILKNAERLAETAKTKEDKDKRLKFFKEMAVKWREQKLHDLLK